MIRRLLARLLPPPSPVSAMKKAALDDLLAAPPIDIAALQERTDRLIADVRAMRTGPDQRMAGEF